MATPPRECAACGRAGTDYYDRDPETGGRCPTRVWCAACYERVAARYGREHREDMRCENESRLRDRLEERGGWRPDDGAPPKLYPI